ncbi:MAG: DEAD/DEAH box helicase, partial [Opitutae bacterium]|nr:DEAD/DEAH box helicase [Opitutae bacterium]
RLSLAAVASAEQPDRLDLQLLAPDGAPATGACLLLSHPEPLYEFHGRVFRGPPALPARKLPTQALADPAIMARLRAMDISLPAVLAARLHRVALRPVLRCRVSANDFYEGQHTFHAELFAHGDDPPCTQHWLGEGGWQWTADGAPAPRAPTAPILELDLAAANAVGARFADFKLNWNTYAKSWTRAVTRNFPDEFLDWRASLPPGLTIEAQGELAGLAGPPVRGHLDFSARPAAGDAGRDWFDLTVALRVEDTTLTAEEIALLLKARGKWVQLPRTGWRRLEIADSAETRATLDRLGLVAADLADTGRPVAHRIHALQLAREATALESRDAALAAALRERAAAITAIAPPAVPARLLAELRPYQREGFHFLAHLAANGLGGVLADDMGLGKTVQTLAWLLHLAENSDRHEPARSADQPAATDAVNATAPARRKPGRPKKSGAAATVASVPAAAPATTRAPAGAVRAFRVLVVCPKSVVHGWLTEAARFAPSLTIAAFTPALTGAPAATGDAQLLIANYAQLRLNAEWFQQQTWDAVILDEAQFIKNPTSLTAAVARSLATRHRLALTGTPVENRLLDLWSLLAFAQPGLLGTQAAFKRQHPDDDPGAPARLQRRAHHFLLRRTKAQVATDLPSRTEDEIVVELEPAQRQLYDAELKRARAQLLGLETDRALDAVRFNILSSLLRLRQICCHPALVDPAHADLPSAKLDALLERLEELRDEGHQVLVFSQFVGMLELIRARLVAAGIGHLLLIGATENRAELVEKFQRDRTQTVFLLSLKAAGFGLNLTAASYAILYDPWWNPAVEAQAIDRTHRIGQTRPVTAYRLLADNTIEQKIRLLQKEKATLAGAIVQEESLASVLDLESLKKILG